MAIELAKLIKIWKYNLLNYIFLFLLFKFVPRLSLVKLQ